jgi:hypothetical protein
VSEVVLSTEHEGRRVLSPPNVQLGGGAQAAQGFRAACEPSPEKSWLALIGHRESNEVRWSRRVKTTSRGRHNWLRR